MVKYSLIILMTCIFESRLNPLFPDRIGISGMGETLGPRKNLAEQGRETEAQPTYKQINGKQNRLLSSH